MFYVDDILFSVALATGGCLVLGSAFGFTDFGADADADADVDADGADADLWSLLGLGRVPLVIALMVSTLSFGVIGFTFAPGWRALLPSGLALGASLVASLTLAWLTTVTSTRILARVLPTTESYASRKCELVGARATVIVATRKGDAVLRAVDAGGAELRLVANAGDRDFRPGEQLSLVSYDPASDRFEIEAIEP